MLLAYSLSEGLSRKPVQRLPLYSFRATVKALCSFSQSWSDGHALKMHGIEK